MAMEIMAYITVIALLITVAGAASDTPAPAAAKYTNHTVGDASGWFFDATTNTSSANYSSWAASQTFNLGDYLIFNTNMNQTVIQTYNMTTYRSCNMVYYTWDDTFQYGGGIDQFGMPVMIVVPLTVQGTNYYFSDADNSVQCQQGMAFEIVVNHGLGLPPSLDQLPPQPYEEPLTPSDVQLLPVTVVTKQPTGSGLRSIANLRWAVWEFGYAIWSLFRATPTPLL